MRIAVFSDVHGNVRALEAVLAQVRARGPFDAVINAGDLVFGGPRPREAIEVLMRGAYTTVLGNTDEWMVEEGEPASRVAAWGRRQLEDRHVEFLRRLPTLHRVEPPGGPPLVVVHATPTSVSEVLDPEAPAEVVARMLEQARTRTLVYGHIHRAYIREIAGGLVVNAGSVGFPFDAVPKPSFALFELRADRWSAEIVRVDYEHEAVAQDLLRSSHPDAATFARRVRTARM